MCDDVKFKEYDDQDVKSNIYDAQKCLEEVNGNFEHQSEIAEDKVVPPPQPPQPKPHDWSRKQRKLSCSDKKAIFIPHTIVTSRMLQLTEAESERVLAARSRRHQVRPPPRAPPLPNYLYPQQSNVKSTPRSINK